MTQGHACVNLYSCGGKLLQCNKKIVQCSKAATDIMDRPVALFSRSDDVRKRNRERIIAMLRRTSRLSRKDIGVQTGLSPATVTAITSDLLRESVLEVADSPGPSLAARGRPKVALSLNPRAAHVAAVVFRLNSISATVLDYTGAIVGHASSEPDTLGASAAAIRGALLESIAAAMESAGVETIRRVAVGVQGVTDVDGEVLLWSPVTRHRGLPIAQWLGQAYSCPVSVANDCDLLVRALNWRDPQRYGTNFAVVLMSQGVGMGLYRQGRIVNGTVSSGCEFGHMMHQPNGAQCRCGSRGCIEAYTAGYALERRAMGRDTATPPLGIGHAPDIAAIAQAAKRGDADAVAAFREAGEALGFGLGTLFALVDPVPVVDGGRRTPSRRNCLETSMRSALARTMAGQAAQGIAIDWVADEKELMQEGCALNALLLLDLEFAQMLDENGVAA